MIKKCKGCGVELQNADNRLPGYVVDLDQDYCKRCFRLTHYGDLTNYNRKAILNEDIYRIYEQYSDDVFVLVIDFLDAFLIDSDDLLEHFKDRKVILIINKLDILPKNVKDEKLDDTYMTIIKRVNDRYHNIISAILTHKSDSSFRDVFFDTLDSFKLNKVIFAGRANAGKSSLINKILNSDNLTTSMYPGTTLDSVTLYKDGVEFIDTPGLIDNNNIAAYLSLNDFKEVMMKDTINTITFQLNESQSYFIENILRVDVITKGQASVNFYMDRSLNIHRSNYYNADKYLSNKKNYHITLGPKTATEFSCHNKTMFYLKGLGMVKVSGNCKIVIHYHKDIFIYQQEAYL